MTSKSRGAFSEVLGLLRPFRVIVVVSIMLGMLGGLSITALLATINDALNAAGTRQPGCWQRLSACARWRC